MQGFCLCCIPYRISKNQTMPVTYQVLMKHSWKEGMEGPVSLLLLPGVQPRPAVLRTGRGRRARTHRTSLRAKGKNSADQLNHWYPQSIPGRASAPQSLPGHPDMAQHRAPPKHGRDMERLGIKSAPCHTWPAEPLEAPGGIPPPRRPWPTFH